MGLNYTLRTYISKKKLASFLKWLYNHTCKFDNAPLQVIVDNEILHINGNYFRTTKDSFYLKTSASLNEFDVLDFSTSLIFDIDPKIVSSLANSQLEYNHELLKDFKDYFENCYLGDGKIRIGFFDTTITKLKNNEIYEIDFTAVTSSMSLMIEESISVRKWALELSNISESIMTYLDLEHNGKKILYYKGCELDFLIKSLPEDESIKNFFFDYYNFEFDFKNKIQK